jgi:hypothetical protein
MSMTAADLAVLATVLGVLQFGLNLLDRMYLRRGEKPTKAGDGRPDQSAACAFDHRAMQETSRKLEESQAALNDNVAELARLLKSQMELQYDRHHELLRTIAKH